MNTNLRNLLVSLVLGLPFSTPVTANAAPFSNAETSADQEVKYDGPLNIKLITRVDYQREYQQTDKLDDRSGFRGNNVMINIQGNLTNKFSYRFRHRINQTKSNNSFFDATDYMWLQYNFNNRFDVRAGKVAVEYGSTEYQRDPSDQYFFSEFWNYPACYLFGVNLGFNVTANDRLVAQVAESSFRTKDNDLYSYALSWYGNHNWFHTMYTANMTEYRNGKYVYYLSFGNQFDLSRNVMLNIDYQNRFDSKDNFFKDYTLRGELMYRPSEHVNLVGLAVYSGNKARDLGPKYITYGTDLTRFGGVVEYRPIPKIDNTLVLHAAYSYATGYEGVEETSPKQNRHLFSVGVHWEMDIIALAKKIWNK